MGDCPAFFRAIELFPPAGTKGQDSLLQLFDMVFGIVAHPNIFLHCLIFSIGNIDIAVGVVSQAPGDLGCVPVICFSLIGSLWHSGWCQDDTLNTVCGQ